MTSLDESPEAETLAQPGPLPWRDTSRPNADRVEDLLSRMTLAEKFGQLYSVWRDADASGGGDTSGAEVSPYQQDLSDISHEWDELIRDGLGQLTRHYGTAPVNAQEAAQRLADTQAQIMAASRFGIPAMVHEECLTGFVTWTATAYPTPLAWGASFDPELIEQMARQIGASMRAVGVHQGLAPVLDVTLDPRWGRTEETIGEDPYLVGTVGTAYVRGLESTGLVATLKHFAGYSASVGARNLAPALIGPRQVASMLLPPFEMAIRDGGARSVMHSYAEIDGIPAAANSELLTTVLRDGWGFTGTVVADYFGISFLQLLHGVAGSAAEAGTLALTAGVDVELPTVRCYGSPTLDAVRRGVISEDLVDRAARRVLLQKCQLGLLDEDWSPHGDVSGSGRVELDPPSARATARRLAEESIVLLSNDGMLPLRQMGRIGVVGPCADDPRAMLGCYSFPNHVGIKYPDLALGVEIPTFLEALRDEFRTSRIRFAQGCRISDSDVAGIAEAARVAAGSDVCFAVLGDRSGLFGRGTSGEGCDVTELTLPGVQAQLLKAVLATHTPVILVLLTGRPYALGDFDGLAATVQAFFPGEEGGAALARVISGAVNPSGHLPVSVPRRLGAQPTSYLGPPLAHRARKTTIDPTALYPFGHGLSYTTFEWDELLVNGRPADPGAATASQTSGSVTVSVAVSNVGDRDGTELVQLYLHDPVAQVTRPVVQLIGYARVGIPAGQRRRVTFTVHADLTSFVGRSGDRLVEPGRIELLLGTSSERTPFVALVDLVGATRTVDHARVLTADVTISRAG